MDLNEYEEINPLTNKTVLLFGDPGTGKTHLTGELANLFHLHYFDLDRGINTLKKREDINKSNITIYPVHDTATSPQAYRVFMTMVKQPKSSFKICIAHGVLNCVQCAKVETAKWSVFPGLANLTQKDCVVIDSVSQLAQSILAHVMSNSADGAKPEWDHYFTQGTILNTILGEFKAHQSAFVAIAHAQEIEMEDESKKFGPMVGTNKYSRSVGKFFDARVFATIKGIQYAVINNPLANTRILVNSRGTLDLSKQNPPTILPLFEETCGSQDSAAATIKATEQALTTKIQSTNVNNLFGKKN